MPARASQLVALGAIGAGLWSFSSGSSRPPGHSPAATQAVGCREHDVFVPPTPSDTRGGESFYFCELDGGHFVCPRCGANLKDTPVDPEHSACKPPSSA